MKQSENELATANPAQEAQSARTLPKGVDPDEVRTKMAAGLTREQAVEIIIAQQEHEKTNPHDPTPLPKKKPLAAVAAPAQEKDLKEHTVEELKEIAANKNVELKSGMTKAEIIEAIEAAD